jgi:integrase
MYRPGDAYELAAPKTKRSRRAMRIPPEAVAALEEHRRRQRLERIAAGPGWRAIDLVFTTESGGPLAGSTVVHALHRHLAAAGLPRQRFHDIRHAALSYLDEAGVGRGDIMPYAGHTDSKTTDRYTHSAPKSRAIVDAMSRLLERRERKEEAR